MRTLSSVLACTLVVGGLFGCEKEPAPPAASEVSVEPAPRVADPARGRELMAHYECGRCHEGETLTPVSDEQHCVRCHREIHEGTFDAPAVHLRRWNRRLHRLDHAPSLDSLQLREEWVASFLVEPMDLRPGLPATMPRFGIDADEAADIAAALLEHVEGEDEAPTTEVSPEQIAAGRTLLEEKGCRTCHAYGGMLGPALETSADAAHTLAPDLRYTRERMTRETIVRWLGDPRSVRPQTPMPRIPLSPDEIERIADALLEAPLEEAAPTVVAARLPLLERPVRFDEVATRVLQDTCWHCHSDPDFARGDGGPGNTGGFGFPARGAILSDYAGLSTGYVDDDGERRSLFAEDEDGTPHFVRVLLARHAEEAGEPIEGLTGMPLGLPALSMEDIQLVESWIAQGRPR